MASSVLPVGLVQLSCGDDPAENLQRHEEAIDRAASQGARLIVLQELFRTRYFCDEERDDRFALAESVPGPTTEALALVARRLQAALVVPLFEKRAEGLFYNTAAVLDTDGRYLGKYRKMHIPDDPGYYEKYYFTPGDLGYRVFDTSVGRVGVLICWDQWYPEAARITALMGADLLVYPTAIGWHQDEEPTRRAEQRDAWRVIQRAHAVANGIPVVSVNRTGTEGAQTFWGSSFACNAHGRILADLPVEDEAVQVVELDLGETAYYRTAWPYLRDRRIDSYEPITERYLDAAPDAPSSSR